MKGGRRSSSGQAPTFPRLFEFMARKSIKEKESSLYKYVVFTLTSLCLFTIAILVIFVVTGGSEPSALIACFFGTFGGELFMCAMIKRLKLKTEKGDKDE